MVLQQGKPIAIWGSADPGEAVTVHFRSQQVTTRADAKGDWLTHLPAMRAEPGQTGSVLRIEGSDRVEFQDVLVGEVWLGSGQSNMQMGMQAFRAGRDALPSANHPQIRLMTKERPPMPEVPGYPGKEYVGWAICTPDTAKNFSSTAYFFARRIHQELGVPVGLITASVGGTSSAPWVPFEALEADPKLKRDLDKVMANQPENYHELMVERARWHHNGRKGEQPKWIPPQPGSLYELYIKPLAPFTLRGVIWDQGEGGTGLGGATYADVFSVLQTSWRAAFADNELPFIYIQMPKGGGWGPHSYDAKGNPQALPPLPAAVPQDRHRRDDFLGPMLALPHTYMAASFDLEIEVHPQSKHLYGDRFAVTALNKVYGRSDIPCEGPTPRDTTVRDAEVRVAFDHAEGGLQPLGGDRIQGFALAGPDGSFHWAEARAEGDAVILHAAAVTEPRQVAYGWAKDPFWANGFNHHGLPIQPFQQTLKP